MGPKPRIIPRMQTAKLESPLSKEERKVSSNLKWFTSQITNELPGPKINTSHSTMYALNKLDEKVKKDLQKEENNRKDERKMVKNHIFYGSHYQQLDQKYMPKAVVAPESLKSWQKAVQVISWNRNPENVHTKKARDLLFYNSTRPY